jgi:hypothetical protein
VHACLGRSAFRWSRVSFTVCHIVLTLRCRLGRMHWVQDRVGRLVRTNWRLMPLAVRRTVLTQWGRMHRVLEPVMQGIHHLCIAEVDHPCSIDTITHRDRHGHAQLLVHTYITHKHDQICNPSMKFTHLHLFVSACLDYCTSNPQPCFSCRPRIPARSTEALELGRYVVSETKQHDAPSKT